MPSALAQGSGWGIYSHDVVRTYVHIYIRGVTLRNVADERPGRLRIALACTMQSRSGTGRTAFLDCVPGMGRSLSISLLLMASHEIDIGL